MEEKDLICSNRFDDQKQPLCSGKRFSSWKNQHTGSIIPRYG